MYVVEIEEAVRERTKYVKSVAHDFGHLKRTAIGAKWFVKISGGYEKEQELAYIAGFCHDFERPLTEKIEHRDISVREAEKFLSDFDIYPGDKKVILKLIDVHRVLTDLPVFEQSVFLADKILEQMGAYNTLRRSIFVGEITETDYKDVPFEEAIETQFTWRMEKFNPDVFPKQFTRLVDYQFNWPKIFIEAFKRREEWAVRFARQAYENGKRHEMNVEEFFKSFKSIAEKDEEFKKEALDYMEGKKFSLFETLTD